MTDNEIIKALECCSKEYWVCDIECPFYSECSKYLMAKSSLDIINRQKAEIERLKDELEQSEQGADIIETMLEEKNKDISDLIFKERSNAITEFAESLKNIFVTIDGVFEVSEIEEYINDLVKEMTEVE